MKTAGTTSNEPGPFSKLEDTESLNPITNKVIGCAYQVINTLGAGFMEKVYENALALELHKAGLKALQQHPIQVYYDGSVVGDFYADLLVEDRVLVELKAVKMLDDVHFAQCLNYLKASGLRLCLLINFGAKNLVIKRIVL